MQIYSVLFCCALLLGVQCSEASYGASKTDDGCASDHKAHDQFFLSGEWQPTIVTGSPKQCDTPGCTDDFWGPRSRFEVEPVCPRDLVYDYTALLREMAKDGSDWAKQALILQPCDLWKVFKGRTTWVIGDSVTEDVGHAMSAFMLEYWDKAHWNVTLSHDPRIQAGLEHGSREGSGKNAVKRVSIYTFQCTVPHWCFQMGTPEEPGRLCYLKADRGKRTLHLLHILPLISQPEDILLVNIGMHYNDMEELEEDMSMLGFALGNPSLPKHRIWVETAPQHYDTPTGMFDISKPIKEQYCVPAGHFLGTNITTFPNGSIGLKAGIREPHPGSHRSIGLQRLLQGGDRNLVTQPIVDAIGMETLRTWNISLSAHQFHTHIHLKGDGDCDVIQCDCTHACHPSWPQVVMADIINIMRRRVSFEDSS